MPRFGNRMLSLASAKDRGRNITFSDDTVKNVKVPINDEYRDFSVFV